MFQVQTHNSSSPPHVIVEKTRQQDHCIFHIKSDNEIHIKSDGIHYPEDSIPEHLDMDGASHNISPSTLRINRRYSDGEAFLQNVQERMKQDKLEYLKSTLNVTSKQGKNRVLKVLGAKNQTLLKLEDNPRTTRERRHSVADSRNAPSPQPSPKANQKELFV
jgi:hypothetical protein